MKTLKKTESENGLVCTDLCYIILQRPQKSSTIRHLDTLQRMPCFDGKNLTYAGDIRL